MARGMRLQAVAFTDEELEHFAPTWKPVRRDKVRPKEAMEHLPTRHDRQVS